MPFGRQTLPLLLLITACHAADAFTPPGASVFTPPAQYRVWWSEVEACSGRTGDFDAVTWLRVDPPALLQDQDGTPVRGLWIAPGNRIAIHADYLERPLVPKHEMLHALLRVPGHPREYFVTRCQLGVN